MDKVRIIEDILNTEISFTKRFIDKDNTQLMDAITNHDNPRLKVLKHAIKEGYINKTITVTGLKLHLLTDYKLRDSGIYKFNDNHALKYLLLMLVIGFQFSWSGYNYETGIYKGELPKYEEAIDYDILAKLGGYAIDYDNGLLYNVSELNLKF